MGIAVAALTLFGMLMLLVGAGRMEDGTTPDAAQNPAESDQQTFHRAA